MTLNYEAQKALVTLGAAMNLLRRAIEAEDWPMVGVYGRIIEVETSIIVEEAPHVR